MAGACGGLGESMLGGIERICWQADDTQGKSFILWGAKCVVKFKWKAESWKMKDADSQCHSQP